MPLTSDITINFLKFDPASVSPQAKELNNKIIANFDPAAQWNVVGAAKYREMRWRGETALPAPKLLPDALDIKIPSRDTGRDIPCRLVYPSARKTDQERKGVKGVVMHFHGGGWVLGDERSTDPLLQHYADGGDLVAISVGYRLAPEDSFPKGPEDCIDVGEYLVDNAEKEYGAPLQFIGGESAGAHLTLLTFFHLFKSRSTFSLRGGLLLHFGIYDLSLTPSVTHFTKNLVLNRSTMQNFITALLPNALLQSQGKNPSISPYYEDLAPFRGRLPAALFTVGTEDPLVDDTVNMGVKWLTSGGEAVIKVYPGACHGFIGFAALGLQEAKDALEDSKIFIQDALAKA